MSSRFDVQHITSGFLLFFGSPNPQKCPMLTSQISIMSNRHGFCGTIDDMNGSLCYEN